MMVVCVSEKERERDGEDDFEGLFQVKMRGSPF